MYHKSIFRNQIWWLTLPIGGFFILLLGAFTYLFYSFQRDHYEADLLRYRDFAKERLLDDCRNKRVLISLLKPMVAAIATKRDASVKDLENTLKPYWQLIREIPVLTNDFSLAFILSSQGELFIGERGSDMFKLQDDMSLSFLVNPIVLGQSHVDSNDRFYMSPIFHYTREDGVSGQHAFIAQALFEEGTGRFLGSYGLAIYIPEWLSMILDLLGNIEAVVVLDEQFEHFAMSSAIQEKILIEPNFVKDLFSAFLNTKGTKEGIIFNQLPSVKDHNLNISFIPIEIDEFREPIYVLLGFPVLTYWHFAREMYIPIVLFSIIVIFLSFIKVYAFMEIFIWRPLQLLTTHIVDISSTGNFFVELPESILIKEINYLFVQFKYFQKRLASLLFEMKSLYQQSSSTQDVIFEKSSQVYFDSKEVIDRSVKLDSDSEFLNQFLDKFTDRYTSLFELSEQVISMLGQTFSWKDDILVSWAQISEMADSLDPSMDHEELAMHINRIKEWKRLNGGSLAIIIKELLEVQNLLSQFNQNRLDMTNAFFDVRQSLNFLMENTRDTISFLEKLKGEVEELFLVQSQDLQRNRDRMKVLLKNV